MRHVVFCYEIKYDKNVRVMFHDYGIISAIVTNKVKADQSSENKILPEKYYLQVSENAGGIFLWIASAGFCNIYCKLCRK